MDRFHYFTVRFSSSTTTTITRFLQIRFYRIEVSTNGNFCNFDRPIRNPVTFNHSKRYLRLLRYTELQGRFVHITTFFKRVRVDPVLRRNSRIVLILTLRSIIRQQLCLSTRKYRLRMRLRNLSRRIRIIIPFFFHML